MFIHKDTSARATDTETPWDISNTYQLQYWRKQHLTHLLKSLNKLWQKSHVAFSFIKE